MLMEVSAGGIDLSGATSVVESAGDMVVTVAGKALGLATSNPIMLIGFGVALVLGVAGFVFRKSGLSRR